MPVAQLTKMSQTQATSSERALKAAFGLLLVGALLVQTASAVITVQIGGATRLSSLTRQRDRYNCYWDCDLVGCQIARDDDECAYDCEKICRIRYDYAGRSSGAAPASAAASAGLSELRPKSAADSSEATGQDQQQQQPGAIGGQEAEFLGPEPQLDSTCRGTRAPGTLPSGNDAPPTRQQAN